jgi:hypothetical protein
MRLLFSAVVAVVALFVGAASAQMVVLDLSGRYRCVQNCLSGPPGQFAYITQSGTEMNMVNDAGMPSRAWFEYPGRIWVDRAQQGATYSSDGMFITFDRGTVWQRDVGPEYRTPARREVAPRAVVRAPSGSSAYDGSWNVVIMTEAGPCDREYRFGAQIANGNVLYDGGPANLQGQVAPDGSIWVAVSAGSQQAQGQGRLFSTTGTGTWRGQGVAGSCVGTWQAVRRG